MFSGCTAYRAREIKRLQTSERLHLRVKSEARAGRYINDILIPNYRPKYGAVEIRMSSSFNLGRERL